MRNLPPAVRQKIAILLKSKQNQMATPIVRPIPTMMPPRLTSPLANPLAPASINLSSPNIPGLPKISGLPQAPKFGSIKKRLF